MGLQVGRLIGDKAVGHGMGFVEAVPGELEQDLEDFLALGRRHVMQFLCAFDEAHLHGNQVLDLLFAHGAAQDVCFAQRKAGQDGGRLHDLFLVQDHSVCIGQDRVQQRMDGFHGMVEPAAFDEFFRHTRVQRTRAVQGHEGDQVLHGLGRQAHNQTGHACTFQLEYALGVAGAEHVAHRLVFQRDVVQIHGFARRFLDEAHGVGHDGQGPQAQEVHLQEAQFLDLILVILRCDHTVLADAFALDAFVQLQRHQVDQRFRRNDDARRVGTRVAGQALDTLGNVDQVMDPFVCFVQGLQFAA